MNRCQRCLRKLSPKNNTNRCPECEPSFIEYNRQKRLAQQQDGTYIEYIPSPRKPRRGLGGQEGVFKAIVWFLREFKRQNDHTRGTGYYALDDISPWQEIALRHWEDNDS